MPFDESLLLFLEEQCDEAKCRALIHKSMSENYSRRHRFLTLPIIVISSTCASASFFSGSLNNKDAERYVVIGTGVLSLVVGVISSVSSFLALAARSEGHRVAQLAWMKYYNQIMWQLSLSEEYRGDGADLLVNLKAESERLFEISPVLETRFLETFRKKMTDGDPNYKKPFYINGNKHTHAYTPEGPQAFPDNSSE